MKLNTDEAGFRDVQVQLTDFKKLSILLHVLSDEMKSRYSRDTCLYNLTGLRIGHDDVDFIQDGDQFYLDPSGKPFAMTQIIDQYQIDKLLGEGGFGKVFRAYHKKTKEVVAVKTIDITDYYKQADKIDQIYKEAKIL